MMNKYNYEKYWETPEEKIFLPRYWLALSLIDFRGRRCVDLGGGEGTFAEMVREKGNKVCVVDISQQGVLMAQRKGLDAQVVDLSQDKYPFETDSMDAVFCLEAIEHLENPQNCLAEISRIIRPNGILIISTPNAEEPNNYPHHLHAWTYKEFRELIMKFNFTIEKEKGLAYFKGGGHISNRLNFLIQNYFFSNFPKLCDDWIIRARFNGI